jgi:hypothetical protein
MNSSYISAFSPPSLSPWLYEEAIMPKFYFGA